MIELGKTKIKMSRLGQGTGVHGGDRQSDQTRMGFAKLVDLMHHAYDRGIPLFRSGRPVRHARVLPRSAQGDGARRSGDPDQDVVAIRRAGGSNEFARAPADGADCARAISPRANDLSRHRAAALPHEAGLGPADGTRTWTCSTTRRRKAGSKRSVAHATILGRCKRRPSRLGRRDPGPHQHEGRQGSDDGRLARRGRRRAAHRPRRTAKRSSA